jgi:predicted Zn finger-like uncharacterized protein
MIITCASCLTKFNLDDSRIPPKGVKVRCSRCHHVFYVVPPPETKEEVMEDFESFAKFHEDLIMPGEESALKPGREEERKEPLSPQKEEEEPLQKPMPPKAEALEQEEDALLFQEKGLKEREETEVKPAEPKEPVRRKERRGPALLFAVLFVLLLLAFGLFYLWTEMGSGGKLSPYFETPGQKIKQVLNKIWGTEKGGLTIDDLTGYEEKVGDMSLFIIEGRVSNQSRFTKKQIKVKVLIFDQDRIKLAEKEAICGRILSRQELKSQPPAFFKGEMVIKPQAEKEMVVSSGKVAPFMVVFQDPLSRAKEFKVEIIEAPNL